jgi:hypothetical protein
MQRFPYQDEPLSGRPPPSLPPSATVRWRPLVPVSIIGPTGKRRVFSRAVLDPGADDTVFPLAVVGLIDVTLRPDSGHRVRWRGQGYSLRFGDVELELSDGTEVRRWPAVVGFSVAPLRYPILGISGCLQFFDARFLGERRVAELETNPSFSGTTFLVQPG